MRNVVMVLIAALCVGSCGSSGNSATAPSGPPPPANVAGVWRYSSTVTSVSGGECLAADLQTLIGDKGSGTIQISQSGASLSAIVTDSSSGSSCSYTGTAGASSMALNTNSCTASDLLGVRCSNGNIRNIRLQTGAITATVSGATASGTNAESYNLTTNSGTGVGIVTINQSFTATRN